MMRVLSGSRTGEEDEAASVPGGGSLMNRRCGLERVGSMAAGTSAEEEEEVTSALVVWCTAGAAEMRASGDAEAFRSCGGGV